MFNQLVFIVTNLVGKSLAGVLSRSRLLLKAAVGGNIGLMRVGSGRLQQCNHRLRTVTIMASQLVAAVERNELQAALVILNQLSPDDRVALAENMASINAQHRSVVNSLPRFYCSFSTLSDGTRYLQSVHLQDPFFENAVRTIWFRH
jgi:hypothetical protein